MANRYCVARGVNEVRRNYSYLDMGDWFVRMDIARMDMCGGCLRQSTADRSVEQRNYLRRKQL